mgnify:CR=1 FL=1
MFTSLMQHSKNSLGLGGGLMRNCPLFEILKWPIPALFNILWGTLLVTQKFNIPTPQPSAYEGILSVTFCWIIVHIFLQNSGYAPLHFLNTIFLPRLLFWYPPSSHGPLPPPPTEGLNGVNRQPSNEPKIDRQPSKTEYFYRQPSNDWAKISRQISQISLNDRDRLT